MIRLFIFTMLTVFSTAAFTQDLGVVLGYRSDSGSANAASNVASRGNLQAGLVGKFLETPFQLRTGFMYVQRAYDLTTNNAAAGTVSASFVEIPFGALYKFSDYGGLFAGAALNLNLAKSCPISCTGFNASPIALQFGGSFKVAPQFGFEFYYEQLTTNLEANVLSPRAITVSAMATFD